MSKIPTSNFANYAFGNSVLGNGANLSFLSGDVKLPEAVHSVVRQFRI
jgi:hypothetical protein